MDGGYNWLGSWNLAAHYLRYQPYINLTADTQTHESLENNNDRFPFLLLNPPVVAPAGFVPFVPVNLLLRL